MSLLAHDDALLASAAAIAAGDLRSLDAVHIASAQALEDALDGLVSYAERTPTAACALGVPIARPT